jgi:hypothetical protein
MRRGAVRAAGIGLLAAGVVVAVVLWLVAGARYDDAVADLAPAPLGCTTTLQFDDAGTYTFFLETKGEIDELDGDCEGDARSYDVDADDAPDVDLVLRDEDGRDVDLDRADGPTYDRAGRRGEAVQVVEITDTGEYRLTATTDDTDGVEAVVRVGRDPTRGVAAIRAGSLAALTVGVVGGVTLLVLSRRRPEPAPAVPTGPQWPAGPFGPAPLAPPSAAPPTTPVYTPRPPSYGPPTPPATQPVTTPARPDERPPGGWPGRGGPLPPPSPPT